MTEMTTGNGGGFSLLQDDPETGGGGGHAQLTPNQMRKLNAEPEGDLVKL